MESSKENSFPSLCNTEESTDINGKDSGIEEYVLNDRSVNKHAVEILNDISSSKNTIVDDTLSNVSQNSVDIFHDELLRHKLSEVQLKLEEMTKTVAAERE